MPSNPNEAAPGQEPELEVPGWAPSVFFGLQHLPGILGDGTAQALVVHLGQFDTRQATLRLYDQVTLMLYRSDSDDWTPPAIGSVRATPTAEDVQVTVWASDPSGLYTVLVVYTTADGTWHSVELPQVTGMWQGMIPDDEALAFFVQVVDMAGNVAVDDNSGLYYGSCFPCGDVERVYLPIVLKNEAACAP